MQETPIAIEYLKKYWGYTRFNPLQEEIISYVNSHQDALVILPTGGGKSLCYQIPALMNAGICLVITPLIALMKDQCQSLQQRGIAAEAIYGQMDRDAIEEIYMQCLQGAIKFLFVSPERLVSTLFLDYLADWKMSLVAIDEAHCISQWGHDFRPAYLKIAAIREYISKVPFLALTASATPQVQQDISHYLQLRTPKLFFSTFFRPNIRLQCVQTENKLPALIRLLQSQTGSCIVYCKSRKRTVDVATIAARAGLSIDYYHAGLDLSTRMQKQERWQQGKVNIMACTNAFGMGIDKSNVRLVVHLDVPDTPEAYYQEAGRAGRDGQEASALLFFQEADIHELIEGIDRKHPSPTTIRSIFESLCYYLEIPMGSGMYEEYEFEFVDFVQKFKLNIVEAMSALKLLEQQEIIQYTESLFQPSRVMMQCSREAIEAMELQDADAAAVIQILLRMYGGVWYNLTVINEFDMAIKLQASKSFVEYQLQKLHRNGLIEYDPIHEKPMLKFLQQRVPTSMLYLDQKFLHELKQSYVQRVRFMVDYVQSEQGCRFQQLMSFFGETQPHTCGHCDHCLKEKSRHQRQGAESLKDTILRMLSDKKPWAIQDLTAAFDLAQQKEIMNVIRVLLQEERIQLDATGKIIQEHD
ncbi:MAG TPA: ATP-dependent DNA helicase RecQ [Chitinophagaceae bacterium]|nr:ATP-dependent DNA helicase RecQ [Chitinophagaceae bacterium]